MPWLGVCLHGLHECVCALCIIVLFVLCVRKTKHAITFVMLYHKRKRYSIDPSTEYQGRDRTFLCEDNLHLVL